MTKLIGIILIILLAGCGTMSTQSKESGMKAAKCLASCAIQCGSSAAVDACVCADYTREALIGKGVAAAQCLSLCGIKCGIQALSNPPNPETKGD